MTPVEWAIVGLVALVGVAVVVIPFWKGRQRQDSEPDTAEHDTLAPQGDPLWPWPEWPVTKEKEGRQPRLGKIERGRWTE